MPRDDADDRDDTDTPDKRERPDDGGEPQRKKDGTGYDRIDAVEQFSGVDRRTFLKLTGLGALGATGALTMKQFNVAGMGKLGPTGKNVICDLIESAGDDSGDGDGPNAGGSEDVAEENDQDGDSGWEPSNLSDGIEAYTTSVSVTSGDTLELCVNASGEYKVEIYRLGWYNGDGGRLITDQDGESPTNQPESSTGSNDMVECDWEVTDEVEVGDDWVTGLYYAWVKETSGNGAYAHPFVVKNSEPSADIVVQLPIATQQAYNDWGGKSLYGYNSNGGPSDAVSHNRPYERPFSKHLNWATHLIRWLESEGYSVEYMCDYDVDQEPDRLQEHVIAISSGHDEYCSEDQYDAFMDARGEGVNLAFMGANIFYWRVHFEDDGRTINCPKVDSQDLFRNIGKPEADLMGMASWGSTLGDSGLNGMNQDLQVDGESTDHDWMEDTGFSSGDTVVGVVGDEWAWVNTGHEPDDYTRFFHYEGSESRAPGKGGDQPCDVIVWEADSGAQVFHCGGLSWTWRLDPDPTWDTMEPFPEVRQSKSEVAQPDDGLQTFQKNAFSDMLGE